MSSLNTEVQELLVTMPRQTLQGHSRWVNGAVHLPGGQRIITCSVDGSLRLWDLESDAQIGENWRDENDTGVWSMALSPNGKTVASGSEDGKVKLWKVETGEVIAKWSVHTHIVCALCWSADGNKVLSGSWDGTARVWDVEDRKTVLTIEPRDGWVNAVIYSPDATKIATGGDMYAANIWDAKTGDQLQTLKHGMNGVWSLAWMLDGKKLITGSSDLIRIFDTATWQEIAVLKGHTQVVSAISLSFNGRFLASVSWDKTARLWNLDTNLQIGPPLQHEQHLHCAALSTDGKLLVTGSENKNVYTWDIHAILEEAGLEDLLPLSDLVAALDADATRAEDDELWSGFFNNMTDSAYFPRTYGKYRRPSSRRLAPPLGGPRALFGRMLAPFRRSHSNTNKSTELHQRLRRPIFSRGSHVVEVAAVKDREVIFTAPPPPEKTQQQTQTHAQGSSTTQPVPGANPTTPRPGYPHSLPVRLLAHLMLFLCCASQHANGNAQSTQQQQGQSQGHAQAEISSSQNRPPAAPTSMIPPAPATSPTAPSAASA